MAGNIRIYATSILHPAPTPHKLKMCIGAINFYST